MGREEEACRVLKAPRDFAAEPGHEWVILLGGSGGEGAILSLATTSTLQRWCLLAANTNYGAGAKAPSVGGDFHPDSSPK